MLHLNASWPELVTWIQSSLLADQRGIFATAAQKMLSDEAELLTSLGARWSIRLVCCRRRAAKGD
jgi:hypothetical protein